MGTEDWRGLFDLESSRGSHATHIPPKPKILYLIFWVSWGSGLWCRYIGFKGYSLPIFNANVVNHQPFSGVSHPGPGYTLACWHFFNPALWHFTICPCKLGSQRRMASSFWGWSQEDTVGTIIQQMVLVIFHQSYPYYCLIACLFPAKRPLVFFCFWKSILFGGENMYVSMKWIYQGHS